MNVNLSIYRIRKCVYDGNSRYGTCEGIEAAIRCTESINEDCAKSALFAGDLTLIYSAREVYSNNTCFNQRFDEYFNQDGLCSFQDAKDIYKCVGTKERELRRGPDISYGQSICIMVKAVQECTQELHPTCMGLVNREMPFFAKSLGLNRQGVGRDTLEELPECVKPFLQEKQEFPIVNQLIEELILMKKLLNNP